MVQTDVVRGKKVLDLGSGPGLTGLVAAELGATRVLITDLKEVAELISSNVERYKKERGVEIKAEVVARAYDWSCSVTEQNVPIDNDLVIFSECLYFEQLFEWLHGALLEVVPVGGYALFSYRLRIGRRERPYFETLERHFDIRVMPASEMASELPDLASTEDKTSETKSAGAAVLHGAKAGDTRNALGVYICFARRRE